MFIPRKDMPVELREKMRGGEGIATVTCLAPPETLHHAKIINEVRLPQGAGIGYHKHEDNTEYFIIKSGNGIANDNGKEVKVSAGDIIITGNGSSHSIKNSGEEELVLYAIILN
ncbi:MAG: hypothetical protein Ta2B_03250 [Termitinemataceae bacterium]|nr:MAG: hypothetical protein Ta2B_03250 [Termitinemataceae bacterium]